MVLFRLHPYLNRKGNCFSISCLHHGRQLGQAPRTMFPERIWCRVFFSLVC
ncbi:hypothetical protein PAHAL_9G464900 [Panicum hallii]|uniref:Uncharacterized protein n=1 Tax=Panicum hallii TaxID=206008 RepID=A0A2S3IRL3_9POAL|nr:hypothetical protein PAHAL_9G464900 [Panicum hallii]